MARIYTRTGDRGETGLVGGTRVPKDSIRVDAYGSVDELNSVLGLAKSFVTDTELNLLLRELQNDLFIAGADLASVKSDQKVPRITSERILELERIIDRYEEELPPLNVFILPGGTNAGATLHFARAVARRAERRIVTLGNTDKINDQLIPYINRLSDLLFVLARVINYRQRTVEVQWHSKP
ncbi:MAG: cob(I)yrinic acid a,c-diamide adenosyltransferase [Candidatus Bathyarchaeia archaeon]|jgi:cob(I)alamin adenosyltransferase